MNAAESMSAGSVIELEEPRSTGTSFLLWLACAAGLCGIHRFYLGKPLSGLLYLFTFGLLGVGQVVDLFLLRGLVREANAGRRLVVSPPPRRLLAAPRPSSRASTSEGRAALLHAAARFHGRLTLAQAVATTGLPEQQAEKLLDGLVLDGQADIDNDPDTGAVVYTFAELH
jgi:hypothetical protein